MMKIKNNQYSMSNEIINGAEHNNAPLGVGGSRGDYRLDYLDQLESESIHIMREVAGQFERPALLFSGGKDSIVLVHLALKAFRPGKFPFPLVHIDTGHNFQEALDYRDKLANDIDEKLIVRHVGDTIKGILPVCTSCRNMQRCGYRHKGN